MTDESGLCGTGEYVVFPEHTEEVRQAVLSAAAVTVQGSRTGLCAGAVPQGGTVVNLSRMNRVERVMEGDTPVLVAQAGASLAEIRKAAGRNWLFPPNPTEDTASIGGILSMGSMGGRAAGYGSLHQWVCSLQVVLADGRVLETDPGGYLGAEGTLGVITRATLRLVKPPAYSYGLLCFFESEETACDYLLDLPEALAPARIAMAELFDGCAVDLALSMKEEVSAFRELPDLSEITGGCRLLLSLECDTEDGLFAALEAALTLLEEYSPHGEDTLAAESPEEQKRLDGLRHAVIKAANMRHRSILRETGVLPAFLDAAVPPQALPALWQWTRRNAPGSPGLWGHASLGHLHVHLYEPDSGFTAAFLDRAAALGGGFYQEFGIGKRRRELLAASPLTQEIAVLKSALDPQGKFGRGNRLP